MSRPVTRQSRAPAKVDKKRKESPDKAIEEAAKKARRSYLTDKDYDDSDDNDDSDDSEDHDSFVVEDSSDDADDDHQDDDNDDSDDDGDYEVDEYAFDSDDSTNQICKSSGSGGANCTNENCLLHGKRNRQIAADKKTAEEKAKSAIKTAWRTYDNCRNTRCRNPGCKSVLKREEEAKADEEKKRKAAEAIAAAEKEADERKMFGVLIKEKLKETAAVNSEKKQIDPAMYANDEDMEQLILGFEKSLFKCVICFELHNRSQIQPRTCKCGGDGYDICKGCYKSMSSYACPTCRDKSAFVAPALNKDKKAKADDDVVLISGSVPPSNVGQNVAQPMRNRGSTSANISDLLGPRSGISSSSVIPTENARPRAQHQAAVAVDTNNNNNNNAVTAPVANSVQVPQPHENNRAASAPLSQARQDRLKAEENKKKKIEETSKYEKETIQKFIRYIEMEIFMTKKTKIENGETQFSLSRTIQEGRSSASFTSGIIEGLNKLKESYEKDGYKFKFSYYAASKSVMIDFEFS